MNKTVLLIGNGKLGSTLKKFLYNFNVITFDESNIDQLSNYRGDFLIDCALNEAIEYYYPYLLEHPMPTIIASTNHSKTQIDKINKLSSNLPLFKSDNFSIGIALINKIITTYQKTISLYDLFLFDFHHQNKLDAPSGTSKKINSLLKNKASITSIRSKNILGKHILTLIGDDEEITITHQITSRDVFAKGIIKAINFIQSKSNGYYSMEDLTDEI